MTQCERVSQYMDDFGSITTWEAYRDLGVTRLASRIHDLRCAGMLIKAENCTGKNRYGECVRYTRYSKG